VLTDFMIFYGADRVVLGKRKPMRGILLYGVRSGLVLL